MAFDRHRALQPFIGLHRRIEASQEIHKDFGADGEHDTIRQHLLRAALRGLQHEISTRFAR